MTGLFTIVVGAVIQNSYQHYENFVGETFWTAPIVLMIVGSMIFIISFLGCCGALRESSWMILTFSVFLMLIFLTEIGIGIAGYIKHGELPAILERQFNKTLEDYANSVDAQRAWSLVQGELVCCGINSPNDWRPIFKNKTVPAMCCHLLPKDVKTCTTDYAAQIGCLPKLYEFLDNKSLLLGGVGIGIAIVQLIGVVFACCLSRAFRENYETV
jgi:CD63 antigen